VIPVKIREATSTDDAALTNLECQSPTLGFAPVYSTQSFLARAKVYDEYPVFVAEAEERVIGVGCGALKRVWSGPHEIILAYHFSGPTHPEWRRFGISRAHVGALRRWGRQSGAPHTMWLVGDNNIPMLNWARSYGFRRIGSAVQWMARRGHSAGRSGVTTLLVDIGSDDGKASKVRSEIHTRFGTRDLCPVDLLDSVYRRQPVGGYLGTVVLWNGRDLAWASIWDK
jgi:GNAT superfamily N-acetyltransferase